MQLVPFLEYPLLQVHLKDPTMFSHVAFAPQRLLEHSSISVEKSKPKFHTLMNYRTSTFSTHQCKHVFQKYCYSNVYEKLPVQKDAKFVYGNGDKLNGFQLIISNHEMKLTPVSLYVYSYVHNYVKNSSLQFYTFTSRSVSCVSCIALTEMSSIRI